MKIESASVFGLGKLGACLAATLAARGVNVIGVDIDPEKVRLVNDGLPPVEEPLLAETMQAGHSLLRATLDAREAVQTDASFFIPPTMSLPDGSFSNEFLLKAMQPCASAIRAADKRGHLFVCSSTTTPGACDTVLVPMLEKVSDRCHDPEGVCRRAPPFRGVFVPVIWADFEKTSLLKKKAALPLSECLASL